MAKTNKLGHIQQQTNGEELLLLKGSVRESTLYSQAAVDFATDLGPNMQVNITVEVIPGEINAYYSGRLVKKDGGLAIKLEKFNFEDKKKEDQSRVYFDVVVIKGEDVDLMLPVIET